MTRSSALCAKVTTRGHVYFMWKFELETFAFASAMRRVLKSYHEKNIFILNFTSPKRTLNTFKYHASQFSIIQKPMGSDDLCFQIRMSRNWTLEILIEISMSLLICHYDWFFFQVSQNSITFFFSLFSCSVLVGEFCLVSWLFLDTLEWSERVDKTEN